MRPRTASGTAWRRGATWTGSSNPSGSAWGADAFEYVILEVIEEEMEPWALKETLKTRKAEWTKRLSERASV